MERHLTMKRSQQLTCHDMNANTRGDMQQDSFHLRGTPEKTNPELGETFFLSKEAPFIVWYVHVSSPRHSWNLPITPSSFPPTSQPGVHDEVEPQPTNQVPHCLKNKRQRPSWPCACYPGLGHGITFFGGGEIAMPHYFCFFHFFFFWWCAKIILF